MTYINCVQEDEATGLVAEVYQQWLAANPTRNAVPGILKCFSPRPELLQSIVQLTYPLHFADGHLTRQTKEMIATYVSGLNQCVY